jgi:hypothetical protein
MTELIDFSSKDLPHLRKYSFGNIVFESISQRIFFLLIFLAWMSPLIGGKIGLIASVLTVFTYSFVLRLSCVDWFFLFVVFLMFLVKVLDSDVISSILIFRVYFGFFFFLGVFYSYPNEADRVLRILLKSSVVAILFEAVLINSVLSPSDLVTFPNFSASVAKTEFFGFYQRPHGFGYSSSITGATLVVLTSALIKSHRDQRKKIVDLSLCAIAVLMLCSGQAFAMFAILCIWLVITRMSLGMRFLYIAALFLVVICYFWLWNSFESSLRITSLFKVSPEYLKFLLDFKLVQIEGSIAHLSLNSNDFFFGKKYLSLSDLDAYGGDFGFLEVLRSLGIFGFLSLFCYLLCASSRAVVFSIVLFCLSFSHYSVISCIPGQIVLAYVISYRNRGLGWSEARFS